MRGFIQEGRGRDYRRTFDRPLDGLFSMKDVLLDELERAGSMAELIVELIGQPGLLQHPLPFGQARIHVAHILEDVLPDKLVPTRSLLDLRLQQIARFRSLQLLPLLVERRRRLQRCVCEAKHSRFSCRVVIHILVSLFPARLILSATTR